MEVNLTGKVMIGEARFGLPEDSYTGVIKDAELFESRKYEQPEVREENIRIEFEVHTEDQKVKVFKEDTVEEKEEKTVPLSLFCKTVVTKGSGKYSNSKLYDTLERLGLIEQFEKAIEKVPEIASNSQVFVDWFLEQAKNYTCKVAVVNSKIGISRIAKVNRLVTKENGKE